VAESQLSTHNDSFRSFESSGALVLSFVVCAIDIELPDSHNARKAVPMTRFNIRSTSVALTTSNADNRASDDDASGDANIHTPPRHISADSIDNRSTHNGAGSTRSDTGGVDRCCPE
jgi:hypothetical protein